MDKSIAAVARFVRGFNLLPIKWMRSNSVKVLTKSNSILKTFENQKPQPDFVSEFSTFARQWRWRTFRRRCIEAPQNCSRGRRTSDSVRRLTDKHRTPDARCTPACSAAAVELQSKSEHVISNSFMECIFVLSNKSCA